MEFDFRQKLKNKWGYTLKELMPHPKGPEHDPVITTITLEIISTNALTSGEKDATAKEKIKRWKLCQEIIAACEEDGDGLVDLDSDDLSLIRKCINKAYSGPMIVGQTLGMLEIKKEPKRKKEKSESEDDGASAEDAEGEAKADEAKPNKRRRSKAAKAS